MVKEQLAPDNLRSALEAKLEKLIKLLKKVRKRLENAPKGTLRESKSHGTAQFYLLHEGKSKDGKYLKKNNDKALIQALSQKEHDLAAAKELTAEIKRLTRYLRYSEPSLSDAARKHLSLGKSALAEPLTLSDDEYASKAVDKLIQYQNSGWILGRDLIITEETLTDQLDASRVKSVIMNYLT